VREFPQSSTNQTLRDARATAATGDSQEILLRIWIVAGLFGGRRAHDAEDFGIRAGIVPGHLRNVALSVGLVCVVSGIPIFRGGGQVVEIGTANGNVVGSRAEAVDGESELRSGRAAIANRGALITGRDQNRNAGESRCETFLPLGPRCRRIRLRRGRSKRESRGSRAIAATR
jgi:hypothetical protein